jgi:hypothetical protein
MKKWIGLLMGTMLIIGSGAYVTLRDNNEPKQVAAKRVQAFQEPQTGLKLEHPAELQKAELTQEDAKSKILLRITQGEGEKPLLITVRSETGLRVVATLTKQELLPLLMNNSEKALPQRFKGYKKVSSRTFDLNGVKAGEIIFTYDGPGNIPNQQRFIIYPKDDNTAVYVAMQAQAADFEEVNRDKFEPIAKSLKF